MLYRKQYTWSCTYKCTRNIAQINTHLFLFLQMYTWYCTWYGTNKYTRGLLHTDVHVIWYKQMHALYHINKRIQGIVSYLLRRVHVVLYR